MRMRMSDVFLIPRGQNQTPPNVDVDVASSWRLEHIVCVLVCVLVCSYVYLF